MKENIEKDKAEALEKLKERKKNNDTAYNKYFKQNPAIPKSAIASTPKNKPSIENIVLRQILLNAEIDNPSKLLDSLDLSSSVTGFKGLKIMSEKRKINEEKLDSALIEKLKDPSLKEVYNINNNSNDDIRKEPLKVKLKDLSTFNTKEEAKENKSKDVELNDIKNLLGIEETSFENTTKLFQWAKLDEIDPSFFGGINYTEKHIHTPKEKEQPPIQKTIFVKENLKPNINKASNNLETNSEKPIVKSPAIEMWEARNQKNNQNISNNSPANAASINIKQYRPPSDISETRSSKISEKDKDKCIIISNININPNSGPKYLQKKKSVEGLDTKSTKSLTRSDIKTENKLSGNVSIDMKNSQKKPPLVQKKASLPPKISHKNLPGKKKKSLSPTTVCTRDGDLDVEEFIRVRNIIFNSLIDILIG